MKVCISEISYKFNQYNREYFGGILPRPSFELMDSFNTFGLFECDFYGDEVDNPVIKISQNYDFTSEQVRDILVHEMLHYYLAYTGQDTRVRHGRAFLREAKRLNDTYGMNISSKINKDEYSATEESSSIRRFFSKLF